MQTPTPDLDSATPAVKLTQSDIDRFWSKVNKNGPLPDQSNPHYAGLGRCWMWMGTKDRKGYGQFHLSNKSVKAHRISWIIANGDFPQRTVGAHKCDNVECCNPEHVSPATIAENNADMVAKGRSKKSSGDNHWKRKTPRAFMGKMKKLYEVSVRAIRHRFATGATYRELSKEFNSSVPAISRIVRRVSYRNF